MKRLADWLRLLGWLFAILLLVGWAVFLRPVGLGGPAAYVLVGGTSMQPTLAAKTLVLTLAQPGYEVGDVVAFRVPHAGSDNTPLVIHRIEGGNTSEGFRTRGDNLPHADPWLVMPEDIVGRQVAALPAAGPALGLVRSPIVLASIAAGVATYIVLGWTVANRQPVAPARRPAGLGSPVAKLTSSARGRHATHQ